jgi:hypothetical protein
VQIPEKEVREKRGLIEHRQKLVGRRVALQNRIRSILVGQGLPAPRGAKAWTVLGLAGIAAHARPLAECDPTELWRGRRRPCRPEQRTRREVHEATERSALREEAGTTPRCGNPRDPSRQLAALSIPVTVTCHFRMA